MLSMQRKYFFLCRSFESEIFFLAVKFNILPINLSLQDCILSWTDFHPTPNTEIDLKFLYMLSTQS